MNFVFVKTVATKRFCSMGGTNKAYKVFAFVGLLLLLIIFSREMYTTGLRVIYSYSTQSLQLDFSTET